MANMPIMDDPDGHRVAAADVDMVTMDGRRVRLLVEGTYHRSGDANWYLREPGGLVHVSGHDRAVVAIEAIEPPERKWQPGDVVLTADGLILHRVTPYGDGPWPWCRDPATKSGGLADRMVARPLTLLVRDGKPVGGAS